MPIAKGLPDGVSGHCQMFIENSTASIAFAMQAYGWGYSQNFAPIDRSGRVASPYFRLNDLRGSGTIEGKVQLNAPPQSAGMKYNRGTITLTQQIAGNGSAVDYIAIPCLFNNTKFSIDDKTKDTWDVSCNFVVSGTSGTFTWNGNLITYSQPSPNNAETYQGLTKTYDPNNNVNAATQRFDCEGVPDNNTGEIATIIALIAGLTTPPEPGLKIFATNWQRSDTAGGQVVIDWRQKNSSDYINFPATHSTRAGDRPFVDTDPYILYSTANTPTFANMLWAAFQGQAFADGLTVRPLSTGGTSNQYHVVYEYNNPGATVDGRTWGGGREVFAITSGTNSQLYATQNWAWGDNATSGSTKRQIFFSPQVVYGSSVREFILFRQLSGTTIPEQNPATINAITLPLIGQTNGEPFLGIGIGKVLYEGVKYRVNFGLTASGAFPIAIGYKFYCDTLGIVDNVPDILFTRPWYITTTDDNSQPHWMNTSGLGLPDINIPSTASFLAFTAGV